jgi:hypothetical protein
MAQTNVLQRAWHLSSKTLFFNILSRGSVDQQGWLAKGDYSSGSPYRNILYIEG